MAVTVIDPDAGFVELAFGPGVEPAVVDVYEAEEWFWDVAKKYMKELEDAGRNGEVTDAETYKRWAVAYFGEKFPYLKPELWSVAVCKAVRSAILAEIDRLGKSEPGSSPPA